MPRFAGGLPELAGKSVLLVDDGIATGATTEAAIHGARHRGARSVWVATPVAAVEAVQRLSGMADRVSALLVETDFGAVGRFYLDFSQTTDQEVLEVLFGFRAAA